MMVRFDKIFWRQISAAGLTVVAHSILTGSPEESMIIFWIYVSILMLQEWIFDRNERRAYAEAHRTAAAEHSARRRA